MVAGFTGVHITPRGVISTRVDTEPTPTDTETIPGGDDVSVLALHDESMAGAMCCWSELTVDVDESATAVTVVLRGELDLSSHERLRRVVGDAISAATRDSRVCIIDTSGLHYIDCSSLRALAALSRHARDRKVDMVLLRPSPIVRRMLRLTGYDRELRVVSWSGVRAR